jgi:hypothetical protein
MARKSKLSEKQWADVERRMLEGEAVRALAREYEVSETAIRARKSSQVTEIKAVADQLVTAQQALRRLPITSQGTAQTLAQKLIALSDNLLGAALEGAATSHRLHAIANGIVQEVDDAAPLKSMDSIKAVAILTEVANKAAHVGLNLINANKGQMPVEPPQAPETLPASPQDAAIEYAKFMS